MILNLFSGSSDAHPLADSREIKRVLADLPAADNLKCVAELAGWLESLANSEGVPLLLLFEAIRQVDEAGQPHLRHLTRHYVGRPKGGPADDKPIWSAASGYCAAAADAYEMLLGEYDHALAARDKVKGVEQIAAALPLIHVRLIGALAAHLKWRRFHYEGAPVGLWARIGAAYLAARRDKAESKPLQMYPMLPGGTTANQEYVQALVFEASSLDALSPAEIDLAEKLIAHFAPQFTLNETNRPDNLYWVDAALDQPAKRLATVPTPTPTVRLIGFGQAPEALAALIRVVERGDIPPDLALGGEQSRRPVLKVLRHLAGYWAPNPPQRQHRRLPAKGTLCVLRGFEACLGTLGGETDSMDFGEVWSIENVSLGGFRASIPPRGRPAAVGDLLALQPDGGGNWLLCVVRRFSREADGRALVGIETLTRQGALLPLRRRGGTGFVVGRQQHAVLLDPPAGADAVRLLLPAAYFDLKESYDSQLDGKAILLTPVEPLDGGTDYQIGRYRLRFAD